MQYKPSTNHFYNGQGKWCAPLEIPEFFVCFPGPEGVLIANNQLEKVFFYPRFLVGSAKIMVNSK